MKLKLSLLILGSVAALLGSGCTSTGGGYMTTSKAAPNATAGNIASLKQEIDAGYDATLPRLYQNARGSRELVAKARGVLIFPSVLAAGLVVGAEYGKGALRVGGQPAGYYQTVSGSLGWQLGAQSKAVIFLFMTQDALDRFRRGNGWTAGVDASVALVKIGANGDVDLNTAQQPVIGFVMTNAGLMANLTLEGTKISKLDM
ncbi:BPSL1445 family SYLF domain-containing lipoprotein [Vogesella oryzae]|uniref:BPSL1445 family SYLF domain-containing lipoprotein n=1 Tax=Vogesella oryzae TaxID=1735285 RepID=UPI001C2EC467|nr:YSC84-related protein [Vogesella oryzae]